MNEEKRISGFHSRGVLPHLKREGGIYFVTFRLFGTLPKEILLRLKREREAIIEKAAAAKRPLTWAEEKELFAWYSERVDAYLDKGTGDCYLARPEVASVVEGAVKYFEGTRYELKAWVVMPNHVHAVLKPTGEFGLSEILHSWKSFTAQKANALLGRKEGRFWQNESYDHLVRDDEDLERCCRYTVMNPVAARLCEKPEDWRWSSAFRGTEV